jgi:hypothetical protein
MPTAGYSGTPLLKKLGIREEFSILLINEPPDYAELLEADIRSQLVKKEKVPDLVHLFVKNQADFTRAMKSLKPLYKANPKLIIWVSWYKKSAKIPTDVTEDVIRNYALQHDLVDVKVCAVSESWSGLKLVVPLAKRG